jgi:hypothetical protein
MAPSPPSLMAKQVSFGRETEVYWKLLFPGFILGPIGESSVYRLWLLERRLTHIILSEIRREPDPHHPQRCHRHECRTGTRRRSWWGRQLTLPARHSHRPVCHHSLAECVDPIPRSPLHPYFQRAVCLVLIFALPQTPTVFPPARSSGRATATPTSSSCRSSFLSAFWSPSFSATPPPILRTTRNIRRPTSSKLCQMTMAFTRSECQGLRLVPKLLMLLISYSLYS